MRGTKINDFPHSWYLDRCSPATARGTRACQGGFMKETGITGGVRAAIAWAVLAIAAHAGGVAWGAVAGSGTFDIDVHGFPPNITFDGTLSFANDPRTVGGTPINLGTS